MENFDYAAHITFVLQKGAWVPWHVTFTAVTPPFKTYTIGLDTTNLTFHYDDLYFNYNVPCFLRSDVKRLSQVSTLSNFPDTIKQMVDSFKINRHVWGGVIGAADTATYTYLKELFPSTILLDAKPLSEEITFGIACRRHASEKDWRSE